MNRVRMILFTGFLGVFGFGTTPAQAQSVASAPARRVSYVPSGGYYSGGYDHAAPQSAPLSYGRPITPATVHAYTPSRASTVRHSVGSSYDPTGRHDGLARPWLRY
jgi:hypothetical protein